MRDREALRVLIVDDDATVRSLLRDWLEATGYRVREATSGRGIVALVQSWEPACVLLDLLMIPVDGLAVLRDLQAAGLTPGVPVIVLSAFLAAADQRTLQGEMRARGARAWLGKPIDFDRLRALIDHPPAPWAAPWSEGEEGPE